MSTINPHTTRAAGTILTAAVYNADHINHISNAQALNTDKLEGATPPVVDGQAVLWEGTTGAALKTAGFFPANAATLMSAGAGIVGGGDLSANRSFATDFSTQAEAEAAANNVKSMTALRVRQLLDHANAKASQAEAKAGANDTKWTSPLRVKEAIVALAPKEVRAFAKGTTAAGAQTVSGCIVSGTGTKTVTLSPAAPHADYVLIGQRGFEDGSTSTMTFTNINTTGFTATNIFGRWSFVVLW